MTLSIPAETARAWVEIDLSAVVANARAVAAASGVRLLPMVKANAYGLGAVEISRALEALEPWGYGVGSVEEGEELRAAGIRRPIVVFTPFLSAHPAPYLEHDLRPTIGDLEALRAWIAASSRPFHIEVDTGMGRSGFRWDDVASLHAAARLAGGGPGWEGVFTHFHSADIDPPATERQWERFRNVVRGMACRPALVHAANSAAALEGPRYAGDLVRPGIFLYGGRAGRSTPRPVAKLRARVLAMRRVRPGDSVSYGATWTAASDTRIATLAIGYADGVPRSLAPRGRIEVAERSAPLIGRVTMDMCMVEVPDSVRPGDVATVYGGLVSLDAQAEAAGTISYELLTSIGRRVRRQYSSGS